MVKVTFTLDEKTVAKRRIGRLSEQERHKILRALDELAPLVPKRTRADVNRELRAIRQARVRRTPVG